MAKSSDILATGRRKTAVASVRLVPGTGLITINSREFKDYFPTISLRNYVEQPLRLTNMIEKYDIRARLRGGGVTSQAGALRHGIARALITANVSLREVLKNSGFLTRDSRIKERNKPGQPGARRRFQFSKR